MSRYMDQKVAYELSVIKCNNMLLGWNYWNCRYIEIIIENQELDNVTKLQLVQPLSFGDTVLCYHRKIKHLIFGRYCRYHNISSL